MAERRRTPEGLLSEAARLQSRMARRYQRGPYGAVISADAAPAPAGSLARLLQQMCKWLCDYDAHREDIRCRCGGSGWYPSWKDDPADPDGGYEDGEKYCDCRSGWRLRAREYEAEVERLRARTR